MLKKFLPWIFSARAARRRPARRSMTQWHDAIESCRGILPRRETLNKSASPYQASAPVSSPTFAQPCARAYAAMPAFSTGQISGS